MKLKSILNQLGQLTKDELLTLNKAVIAAAKAKSRVESVIKGAMLKVGQIVEINQRKHIGQKFIITKVNRTRCKIQAKDNKWENYTCPISMLIA